LHPDVVRVAAEEIRSWLGSYRDSAEITRAKQTARVIEIDKEKDALLDLLVRGVITDQDAYKRKDDALLRERNMLVVASQHSSSELAHMSQQATAALTFAELAYDEFQEKDTEHKREIMASLSRSYLLRGSELETGVDPLLEKVVMFASRKKASIETPDVASGSLKNACFDGRIPFGSANESAIELPQDLIDELRSSDFSDRSWYHQRRQGFLADASPNAL
jgi:hypothetical protein